MNGHIPFGVADYFWDEASRRQSLLDQLMETFRGWGYGDVIPPMFEFDSTLSAQYDDRLRSGMYRFLDRDGSTLSLRPEFTTPVARLVGARLHDWPMPQRFCYGGSVFRYLEPQAGRQREFWQVGGELFGAPSPDADAEILALTATALKVAGLTQFRQIVGHIRYYRSLLEALQLDPQQTQQLQWALERKSEPLLEEFLRVTPLRTGQRQAVETLPQLVGENVDGILSLAERHIQNRGMHEALQNLRGIVDALRGYDIQDSFVIDLTEIRNLGYYTGVSFEAVTPGLGTAVASGGRYDDLVGRFGPPQPAVGVALGVDRLLVARQRQDGHGAAYGRQRIQPALALPQGSPDALAQVQRLRQAGLHVQVDVNSWPLDAAFDYAAETDISDVLLWEDGFQHHRRDEQGDFVLLGPLEMSRLSGRTAKCREEPSK
ncbi:MAG: ATP phosphoribosyltransferase regulatory subunit [Caldilineaceae bacterium SB0675_bin_29]|uniref:ATP phosphoribosyltransferase regulatory subunit n=1 Tax=Caldilineaceae bacterium SB0675_bin_29 TaxID=2605266 RepID=A0A6B1G5E6_9CHLR|nr:ATP phosphoribosyltransferase regulatory subunit [Caldilineaceae bacterium SB0675_bin_29]